VEETYEKTRKMEKAWELKEKAWELKEKAGSIGSEPGSSGCGGRIVCGDREINEGPG
jgi:hypothetical protein